MVEKKLRNNPCMHEYPYRIRVKDLIVRGRCFKLYDCSECSNGDGKGVRYWVEVPVSRYTETDIPLNIVSLIREREFARKNYGINFFPEKEK